MITPSPVLKFRIYGYARLRINVSVIANLYISQSNISLSLSLIHKETFKWRYNFGKKTLWSLHVHLELLVLILILHITMLSNIIRISYITHPSKSIFFSLKRILFKCKWIWLKLRVYTCPAFIIFGKTVMSKGG